MSAPPTIGFGTSGLRGPAEGFRPDRVAAYVAAFLEVACDGAAARQVLIGRDLRASSPAIASMVAAAVAACGWEPVDGGAVPTPALALFALTRSIPAIMVTGSHIPPAYNGLKFYRPDGELRKRDEAPIRAAAARHAVRIRPDITPRDASNAVIEAYTARFTDSFPATALSGLRIGVFQHSAVGRDLLVRTLTALGADCCAFGRSETFVAVDTEAVADEHIHLMKQALAQGLDAVVSTDGDGDRPLVLDGRGHQVNGDVLGALTARFLGASRVATPLNSTSAIEKSGWFSKVLRTRIGSPYVVEAMEAEGCDMGFEPNGGVLTGAGFDLPSGRLERLPTRDAVLPIVAVLAAARHRAGGVEALASELPPRVMKSITIKDIAPDRGHRFVAALAESSCARAALGPMLEHPESVDTRDGTRLSFADGTVIHFRQSGNAPELRCYVETDAPETTDALLRTMMHTLQRYFDPRGAGR